MSGGPSSRRLPPAPGASQASAPSPANAAARRAQRLLHGPVLPTILLLAAPNVVVMVSQAGANFLESYYVGLLGVHALAGAALVFPLVMLMQMMSAGGIGGGISSAIARALGAGRHVDAEAIALHAVVIALVAGGLFSVAAIAGGPWLYAAMGGQGEALQAALTYSNVIFAGATFLWLSNILASVLRGSGNMALPAVVLSAGTLVLLVISPVLIFGVGPIPAMGIAGAGLALVVYYVLACSILAYKLLRGAGGLTLSFHHRLRWRFFADILGVGGWALVNTLTTNLAVVIATALVTPLGTQALAGFGLGIRLEYLQIPIVFGVGSGLVAMVGMNVGAGQWVRARQIAWTGACVTAVVTEIVGLAAALWPRGWLGLFTQDPAVIEVGVSYLHGVAPAYGLIGVGLALYFASQGARRMHWSVLAGLMRCGLIALVGGVSVHYFDGGLSHVLASVVLGLLAFACLNAIPWLSAKPPR